MNKYLVIFLTVISLGYDAKAMIFKKDDKDRVLPVFQPKKRWNDENYLSPIVSLLTPVKGEDDQSIKIVAKQYVCAKGEDGTYLCTKDGHHKMILVDATDKEGNILYREATTLDKSAMRQWCDEFKKNSKRPAMWSFSREVGETVITDPYYRDMEISQNNGVFCSSLLSEVNREMQKETDRLRKANRKVNSEEIIESSTDLKFYREIEKLYLSEWKKWEIERGTIPTLRMLYKNEEFSSIIFAQSPYYKHYRSDYKKPKNHPLQRTNGSISLGGTMVGPFYSELENNAYHNTLQSMQVTAEVMKRDLRGKSFFQWIWNYGKYRRTQQALKELNDEIALFKDQDRTVSQKTKDGRTIKLSHRDVFAKSCMPEDLFDQVKRARE